MTLRPKTRGEKVIAFCEKYCKVPEGALVGLPVKFEAFQRKFILDVYDNPHGTHTGYLSIARKNGKSALIACLLLAHIVGPEARQNSQIVSGAMSRDQAAIIHALAAKMVRMSPELSAIVRVVPSGKKLYGLPLNVEYRALSAEAATTHGLSPVLAIIDEMGQIRGPQSDFIDAIETAQGAHASPLTLVVSTQAASDADMLSIRLDDALSGADPHTVVHLYAAHPDAGLMDRAGWSAANPALGIFRSLPDLEKLANAAVRMPSKENTFRNLILNQRVSVISPFISRDVWKANGAPAAEFDKDTLVYGGLDLSSRTDLTALVLIGQIGGVWHVQAHIWTPEDGIKDRAHKDRTPYVEWVDSGYIHTTPGKTVDYEYVARDVADICDGLDIHSIAFDPWRIDLMRKEFARIGIDTETPRKDGGLLPLVEHGQGYKSISPAMEVLEEELLNGRVAHGMNPVLTMCAANAVVIKDPAGNRKLDKSKATGRIDGLVALTMAFGATVIAAGDLEKPKEFTLLSL